MNIELEQNEPTITSDGNGVNESENLTFSELDRQILRFKEKNIDIKSSEKPPQPKIQRVPHVLRYQKKLKNHYQPKWISIGPIHHGDKKFMLADNRYKLNWAAKFIVNCGFQSSDALFHLIKDDIKALKSRFEDEVIKAYKKDDEAFARMLFVDGCFILEFIYSIGYRKSDILEFKNDQISFVLHDLFLLENQIPFEVLQKLMNNSKHRSKELKDSIKWFLRENVMKPRKYHGSLDFDIETILSESPVHLLDLLRMALLHHPKHEFKQLRANFNLFKSVYTYFKYNIPSPLPHQPKDKTLPLTNGQNQIMSNFQDDELIPVSSFGNVRDLKVAGIKLKPSKTASLRDITFTSSYFFGYLRLPPLVVNELTGPKLLNLMAYEMCPDNRRTKYEVSSYLVLLDFLIDNEEDVKHLKSARILQNYLSCDADAAQLFNSTIGAHLVGGDPKAYQEVKNKIQKHYKRRCATWVAQLYHDHFRSPWTILALMAAFTALFLTAVQTWFSIRPSK